MSLETTPHTVEAHPSRVAKLSGRVGRLAVRLRNGTSRTATAARPFETVGVKGLPPLPVESPMGRLLADNLRATPRLERTTWVGTEQFRCSTPVFSFDFSKGGTVRVPVANFIHAAGFESWQGRGGNVKFDQYSNNQGSRQTIARYARKSTPMPPINGAVAYAQPNGMVLFSGVGDGSHRLAAAHLRGDETIEVGGSLSVRQLDHDIMPLPETAAHELSMEGAR